MRRLFLSLAGLALLPLSAAAEKAAPGVSRGKTTSNIREISSKPLYLYSTRGRRDPFVRDSAIGQMPSNPNSNEFSVTELKLVGFVEAGGSPVALFKHRMASTTYTLRGGQLYSPSNQLVPNVLGKVEADRRVLLTQGEKKMHFTSFSSKTP